MNIHEQIIQQINIHESILQQYSLKIQLMNIHGVTHFLLLLFHLPDLILLLNTLHLCLFYLALFLLLVLPGLRLGAVHDQRLLIGVLLLLFNRLPRIPLILYNASGVEFDIWLIGHPNDRLIKSYRLLNN